MKTHLILIGAVSLLGTSFVSTSYAENTSEYLHFTRHRDSNGHLLMGPTQHQAEASVLQKTMLPSQPKTFEKRSTDWGMSVQDVKENEPVTSSWELEPPVLGDFEKRVAYHTQIEGIQAALTYTFYQDHLGQAKYVFEPQHDDAVEFVNDFHTVENWISKSYGLPTSVQEIWLDKLYQYDKSLWGQAVKRGHLVMVAEWKNPGTDIVLVLDGGNDEVGLVADFASTTFAIPVSLDMQAQEEAIEEVLEETTVQEALPSEITADTLDEEVPAQEMSHEVGGSGAFSPETEVASQGPVNDMEELEEIEQMLNEEFPPLTDSVEPSMTETIHEGMLEDAPEATPDTQTLLHGEEVGHENLDNHGLNEQHSIGEEIIPANQIEPFDEGEVSANTAEMSEAIPAEAVIEESGMDVHPSEGQVSEPSVDEHVNDHAMESEEELEPQHL